MNHYQHQYIYVYDIFIQSFQNIMMMMMRWGGKGGCRRCLAYGRDVVSYCYLRLCSLCRSPWLTSRDVLWNVCSWFMPSCLVTSKGTFLVLALYNQLLHPAIKMRVIVPSAKSRKFRARTIQTEHLFSEEKVTAIWNFNGKDRSIISKVRNL